MSISGFLGTRRMFLSPLRRDFPNLAVGVQNLSRSRCSMVHPSIMTRHLGRLVAGRVAATPDPRVPGSVYRSKAVTPSHADPTALPEFHRPPTPRPPPPTVYCMYWRSPQDPRLIFLYTFRPCNRLDPLTHGEAKNDKQSGAGLTGCPSFDEARLSVSTSSCNLVRLIIFAHDS